MGIAKFGGLDVAIRIDNTVLEGVKLEDGVLEQISEKMWPHINYEIIGNDLAVIQDHEHFFQIGYDRLGSGEVVKLFPPIVRNVCRPIISSMPMKQDIIALMKGLFNHGKLIIHTPELYKEILEQEYYKSDAGNMLYRHPAGFHDDRFWALGYACKAAVEYIKQQPRAVSAGPSLSRNLDDEIDRLLNRI